MYEEILKSVKKWLHNKAEEYADILKVKIEDESHDNFLCAIDTERYISSLSVSKQDFRPYRYVEFYALDVNKEPMQQPAFIFHDSESDSVFDILNGLDKGIEFIISE